MGGRGASSGGGRGGGGKSGGTKGMKSSFGLQRDAIRSEINRQFKDSPFNKYITDSNGKRVRIEITANETGRHHMTHDIADHGAMKQSEVSKLAGMFRNSTFVKSSGLKHNRDDFHHFHYFKVQGRELYFNVGEGTERSGKKIYRLYSITTKI